MTMAALVIGFWPANRSYNYTEMYNRKKKKNFGRSQASRETFWQKIYEEYVYQTLSENGFIGKKLQAKKALH